MKAQIRIWIKAGWTRSRIENAFVQQFGKQVLAEPQTHGFDLLAWVLPLGGIGLGAAALGGGAYAWSRSRADEAGGPEEEPAAPLDPELERRVDEELARFDG
jgi:cytochrome c-type biogenesis protein CcmH/NrfF